MEILITIPILVLSAVFHEYMHGWVADKLGDHTARLAGRLTLNPIPHIDPIGSILMPAMLLILSGGQFVFASAKPVPVNPLHLREGRKDLALVALAGPLTNFAIAVVGVIILKVIGTNVDLVSPILFAVVYLNLLLAFFNLLPIPPLDGSKFFSLFLPERIAYQYLSIGQYGLYLLIFLMLFPIGGFSIGDLIGKLIVSFLNFLGI